MPKLKGVVKLIGIEDIDFSILPLSQDDWDIYHDIIGEYKSNLDGIEQQTLKCSWYGYDMRGQND